MNRSRKISCPMRMVQYLQVMMMMIMAVVVLWRGTNVNVIINPVLISAFSTTTTNHHHHHSYAPHTIQHPSHLIRIQNPTLSSNGRKSQQQQQHDSLLFQTNPASRPPPRGSSSSPRSASLSSTRLNMVPVIASSSSLLFGTTAAFVSAISGGICSGGLHAIAGPDHLAALLPRCIGQRWHRAVRVGAIWGIGHGLSATLLGCMAFLIKRTVVSSEYLFRSASSNPLSRFSKVCLQFLTSRGSNVMEIAVGISLIVIGIMGIREARDFKFEYDEPVAVPPTSTSHSLSAAVNVAVTDNHYSTSNAPSLRTRAILLNGILHGFSWDGAPSLAPALALMTWGHTITFLSSYAFGTMVTMALVTTLIGEGTRQASQIFQRPDLPQKFSFASSILAISIGVVWCALGVL